MSSPFDLTPRKIGHRDHTGGVRAFHFLPAAWYAREDRIDSRAIMIGIYHPEGGTSGEFAIREHGLGGSVALRLEVFSDAWSALALFPDLLALLSGLVEGPISLSGMVEEHKRTGTPFHVLADAHRAALPTLESLRPLIAGLGIVDLTQEVRPT